MQAREERIDPVITNGTGKPNRTYRPNRVCEETSCGTKLSRYNVGPGCSKHSYLNQNFRVRGVPADER